MNSCVLFASCARKTPVDIIKLLFDELPERIELEPNIFAYPWHIDNKYYEVDVNLCTLEKRVLGSTVSTSTQAVVLYFDSDDDNGLQEATKWIPYLKEYGVEIQILLCEQCKEESESGITKLSAQQWCIREGFELVELNPLLDEEWECEQDFIETTGIKRVKQALEAHVWPQLILKERQEPKTLSGLMNGGVCKSAVLNHANVSENPIEAITNSLLDEIIGDRNDEPFRFTELFSQLASMKEKASTLPDDRRREFAEQVVCAYWRAIDGDEEELSDY